MSKLSAVSRHVIRQLAKPSWCGVIPFSLLFAAGLLLQGCGNKGDLYRESDVAAIDGLQEAADKLRNSADEDVPGAGPDSGGDEEEDDDEDEDGKKPDKNNDQNTNPGN